MASLFKRTYKSGKTVWAIKYRINGIQKLHTIGSVDKRTADLEFHKFCTNLLSDKSENDQVKDVSFDEFLTEYIRHCRMIKEPLTADREERVLKLFRNYAGNIQVKSVNRSIIDKYIIHRLDQKSNRSAHKIRKATVNLELRHLKAVFNACKNWGYIKSNPFQGIKMLRVEGNPHPKYLEIHEIELVRKAFKDYTLENIVDFYLWTGARLREALSLSWDDVDFKNSCITIKAVNSKSKKYRYIGFDQKSGLGKMLKSLNRRKDNKVFGPVDSQDRELPQWPADYVSRTISKICTKIGLEWATCHTFRHTVASHLIMRNVPIYTVKELLGHSTIKTTEIYAHLADSHKSEMISRLPY